MKRHKREDLEKNPELRKIDFNRAKKACENMLLYPSCIMNFTEGTRYTTKKHATQKSPYQHLLKPKPGGLAFAIETLGPKLAGLLDISIIYPKQNLSFWSFLRGDVKSMIIETRVIQIPNKLLNGSYLDDQEYRDNFKAWLDTIWQEKDASIQRGMRELSA